jgi:hypothetical protein
VACTGLATTKPLEEGKGELKGSGNNNRKNKQIQRRKKRDKEWEYRATPGRILQQTMLYGQSLDKTNLQDFGDKLKKKEQNIFRVIVPNIQKLPESARAEGSRRVVNTIVKTGKTYFL